VIHTRRSLKRWSPMRSAPSPESQSAPTDGDVGDSEKASLSDGGGQPVWNYIVTHARELLMSAFLPSPPLDTETVRVGEAEAEDGGRLLATPSEGAAPATTPTSASTATSAVPPASAFSGVTTEALAVRAVFVLTVPAPPASSTSTSGAGGKKRAWTIPTSALAPASEREKATVSHSIRLSFHMHG
jgi:hypothetical protein